MVLYFYPFCIMKVPEGKTVLVRVGWIVRKWCGGWKALVDCGFGDIGEGCNCAGHVAIWEKQLWKVFPSPCSLLKKQAFKLTLCGMSVGFSKWNPIEPGLNILNQNGSKFNYTLQATWQFPLCSTQSNKTMLNRSGTPVHTGVSVPRQKGRAFDKRPS